jgi:hypothetical protein
MHNHDKVTGFCTCPKRCRWKRKESAVLQKRAQTGLAIRATQLKWGNATFPLGYIMSKSGWLIVEPTEAELVKQVFDNYVFFQSFVQTATALNIAGFTSRLGNPFSPSSVGDILANEIYIGYFQFAGTRKHLKALEIVPAKLFKLVQEIRQKNFEKYGNRHSNCHAKLGACEI